MALPNESGPISSHQPDLDDIFPAVYEELKRVAHRHLQGELTGHTLGTTALVHEAYLELARLNHIRWPAKE